MLHNIHLSYKILCKSKILKLMETVIKWSCAIKITKNKTKQKYVSSRYKMQKKLNLRTSTAKQTAHFPSRVLLKIFPKSHQFGFKSN